MRWPESRIVVALTTAAALCPSAQAAPLVDVEPQAVATLITNVYVLRENGARTGPHDVLLDEGHIRGVLALGEGWGAGAERVVDAAGDTLMPGLIDTHVHLQSSASLPKRMHLPHVQNNLDALLYCGVTSVFDPGWDRKEAERWQGRIADGRSSGPHIVTAGRPFTAPGGHPWSSVRAGYPSLLVRLGTRTIAWGVRDADDVDDAIKAQGITPFYKVVLDDIPGDAPVISDEALAQLRVASTALGNRLVAHVGRPQDLDRALDLGVDGLVHLPWGGRLTATQVARLAEADMPIMPTLTAWQTVADATTGSFSSDALTVATRTPSIAKDVARATERGGVRPTRLDPWMDHLPDLQSEREGNVTVVADSHLRILVGSDTPLMGQPAGSGLHRELDRLVAAGLDPVDAIMAATWANSRFLDPEARFGAIKVGWEADLVLVTGDPTEDFAAVHAIREVWVDGRRVSRKTP